MLKKESLGFTIIEVVLVLAIAGIIFVIAFMAFPELQASRRDTQRKDDAIRLVALLETYHGNEGSLPLTTPQITQFTTEYVDSLIFSDPAEGAYQVDGIAATDPGGHDLYPDIGQIYFKARHVCTPVPGASGDPQIQHMGATAESIALWTRLEIGGVYCVDNA